MEQPRNQKGLKLVVLIPVLISILCFIVIIIYNQNKFNFYNQLFLSILWIFSSISLFLMFTKNKKMFQSIFIIIFSISLSISTLYVLNINLLPQKIHMLDLSNRDLSYVMKWIQKNDLNIDLDYDYSDTVKMNHVIYQTRRINTLISKKDTIKITLSEGPNPNKKVYLPNMETSESLKVLKFIKDNHLNNIKITFKESDYQEDSLIEQSTEGFITRDEEIILTFSSGEEIPSNVTMTDLIGKSKIDAMFLLEKSHIDYEFKEEYNRFIEKDHVSKQEIKRNEIVDLHKKITITISKGKEIIVPDFNNKHLDNIIEWIKENNIKLELASVYDSNIKKGFFVEANYTAGKRILEYDSFELLISKGKLQMRKFSSLKKFRSWVEEKQVRYQEVLESSNNVSAGKIIRFSHKAGQEIKKDDTIIVTISEGKTTKVPDLINKSEKQIKKTLERMNLNYSILYEYNNKIKKGNVISQSIEKDSEVSENTTITVMISKGKKT